MKVVLTGATGNVGSRLLGQLVDAGHECSALVRSNKKLPRGVAAIEGDLLDPDSLARAVHGAHAVVHLAALLRSPDAKAIRQINVEGTGNLIAAVREHAPTARLVMTSTSLVYADDLPHPAKEDDHVAPVAPYPASKVAAELELRNSGVTWSVLRLGFVYGDGDQHLQAVPRLSSLWHWHPAHVLHLIHQRDVGVAITLALTGATDGHIVNVVDAAPITAYEIAGLTGAPIDRSAEPLSNPWAGHLDGTLARSLGFWPTIPTVYHAMRGGAV